MTVLSRAVSAETMKMKRTLALWLTVLTPAALVFLEVAGATQHQGNMRSVPPDVNLWAVLFEEVFTIWVLLIFPLFITLETALLGQLEHSNRTWKLAHTQPVPRWAVLAAKQIWGLALVSLGMLALIGLTVAGGAILDLLLPEVSFQSPIPWKGMFAQTGIVLLASGVILAVHTWIALQTRSFVIASGIGIGLTITGLILEGLLDWTAYFPWSMPAASLYNYYEGAAISSYLLIGVLGWLVLSVFSNLQLRMREIQ